MDRIFIFGGLGFIGHNLALELSSSYKVHVVDNCCSKEEVDPEYLKRAEALENEGIKVHHIDIFDSSAMSELLKDLSIDTVLHLAGASSVKSTYTGEGFAEVLGVTNELLAHLSKANISRIVYFSSSMVYGDFTHTSINEDHIKDPVDRYGALKFASEVLVKHWAKETKTTSIIIRPTAVYGPKDIKLRIVSKLLKQAHSGKELTLFGNGENQLDFTYIDDVVDATILTLNSTDSEEFNVSFGQPRTLNDLAKLIKMVYPDSKVKHNHVFAYPTANRGALNCDKAVRLLGYEPKFTLERGLAKLLNVEGKTELSKNVITNAPCLNIPLGKADLLSTDFKFLNQTLQTGWLTAGPQNHKFEQDFLQCLGAKNQYALSVNSCASALELAVRSHDITGGVIVPAFTFSATANAVIRAGAFPQFVDIEPTYLGLDPIAIEKSITSDTQAVLLVHLAGTICNVDKIIEICERQKLILIEDCAQALAAEFKHKKAGTFGDTSCFSFFPTKMITTGEGGMLITKHKGVYDKAKALTNHGYSTSTKDREKQLKPWLREQTELGSNYRMSSINASLGIAQLNRLDDIASTRRRKALKIIQGIKAIGSIGVYEFNDRYSVYQALNVFLPVHWNRDQFTLELRKEGVMASVHYHESLPESSVFKQYCETPSAYPIAYATSKRIVTLPLFGAITELQIQRMLDVIGNIVIKYSNFEKEDIVG